jgi:hypothetical protein
VSVEGPTQDRPSDKDPIKPFHARDVTTGQETADAVAAVLKHAAAKDEAAKKKSAPKPQPIWMLPVALTLSVLAGFLLVAPPAWVVVNPIAAQAPEEQVETLENAIFIRLNMIETYRARSGSLPPTLAEAGDESGLLDYTPAGQNYTLCGSVAERAVCFNSAVESPRDWAAREIGTAMTRRIGG